MDRSAAIAYHKIDRGAKIERTERIKVVSDDTLLLTDEVSDEALEAAAEMDRGQRAITFVTPICPDPGTGPPSS